MLRTAVARFGRNALLGASRAHSHRLLSPPSAAGAAASSRGSSSMPTSIYQRAASNVASERAPLATPLAYRNIVGSKVFGADTMAALLPATVLAEFQDCVANGRRLPPHIADMVANAMKEWSIINGADSFCHWFQPMGLNARTAEKHDSFIRITGEHKAFEFSGKELIKGESDGSSFFHGGLRGTHFAAGYTSWDPSSPPFIMDNSLMIPAVFCSWDGNALDEKTPLLRSLDALDKQGVRLLRALGDNDTKHVIANCGCEQEFFVIDRKLAQQRPDLLTAGRTLFGADPAKTQQLAQHYFGSMPARVKAYLRDVQRVLWDLHIPIHTRHNEVAPNQFEIAPVYEECNLAADHNMLVMEVLQTTAIQHDLECLLHEKPFANINGSGKHLNWSVDTSDGKPLFFPGKTPFEQTRFIVFVACLLRAINLHADLIRLGTAVPGNELRLGGYEAPPAIISVHLGPLLTQHISDIVSGASKTLSGFSSGSGLEMKFGVSRLPDLAVAAEDRNRTSSFPFCGNRFEFRAVGASQSVSSPGCILATVMAESMQKMVDDIEALGGGSNATYQVVRATLGRHMEVVFNGDGYSSAWVEEASRRNLPNLNNCVDAFETLTSPKNIELFEKMGVLTPTAVRAKQAVLLEEYIKITEIEARTMLQMSRNLIVPAALKDQAEKAHALVTYKQAYGTESAVHKRILDSVSIPLQALVEKAENLESLLAGKGAGGHGSSDDASGMLADAKFYRDQVRTSMARLRAEADKLERSMADNNWPMPTYRSLLFDGVDAPMHSD